jgi:tetratricopeptide (TPR) repeat protein
MRAGCFDDTYGERADQMDWDGLFAACPALFRSFAEHMARRFRHVLVDARSGRSAAVSICTTLLPRKLVGLFTPNARSLDGLAGVVTRAIEYRCSHEDEQRPLLVYPLPCSIDSTDCQRRTEWRRGRAGDDGCAAPGYQPVLERLLRQCYGMSQVSLDSYFDEVQMQHTNAGFAGAPINHAIILDNDRFSLRRTFETLLDWVAEGRFPWQSHAEVRLADAIAAARTQAAETIGTSISIPLARDLHALGELYRVQGRTPQALSCFEESLSLRERFLGDEHADTRHTRAQLADLLRDCGKPDDARTLHQQLLESSLRLFGPHHAQTVGARAALAETLAQLADFNTALALHEQNNDSCERLYGPSHCATFNSLAAQAHTLARDGQRERARMVYERVLEGRERLLGSEHDDTLACTEQLAEVLQWLGDLAHARALQEAVVAARERHAGPDHPATLRAREVLADIMGAQNDLDGVLRVQESLARARERRFGAEHPDTLAIKLRLATTLTQHGKLDAARSLQEQVVALSEKVRGPDDLQTLGGKQALAETLSRQGHSIAARKLEDSVLQTSDRLINSANTAMAAGPHDHQAGALGLRNAILETRDSAGQADSLVDKLAQLQKLIDNRSEREARALADSLRKTVLRPNVANPLRLRGVAMIKQVYMRENDKDALLAFAQDEVSSLTEALAEAAGGRPFATH